MALNYVTRELSNLACYDYFTPDTQRVIVQTQTFLDQELQILMCRPTELSSLIITIVWESSEVHWQKQFQVFLNKLTAKFNKILIIFDSFYKPFNLQFENVSEILYVDFFLYKVYHTLNVSKKMVWSNSWNEKNQKILFMTGKPNKIHRVRLLYKLLNSPIGKYLSWSFRVKATKFDAMRIFLDDINQDQQDKFLRTCQQQLDYNFGTKEGAAGTRFDVDIYRNSLFQIISETYFDRPYSNTWITEKVWLSIANHLPFIIAGEFNTLKILRRLGIQTFENYLDIPNYDSPDNDNFLCYSLDSGKIGFFETLSSQKSWGDFYQQIKAELWPDECNIDQIKTLPRNWQQEVETQYIKPMQSWSEIRLGAIVENSIGFQKNITKYAEYITQDVENNYQKFIFMAKKNQCELENFSRRHSLVCNDVAQLFSIFY
jgi:hypothetical protein